MTTLTAQCALEWWRASGKRSTARLRELVEHFATTNGEMEYLEHHNQSALAAVRSWELED